MQSVESCTTCMWVIVLNYSTVIVVYLKAERTTFVKVPKANKPPSNKLHVNLLEAGMK